jgi:hypothetical protein
MPVHCCWVRLSLIGAGGVTGFNLYSMLDRVSLGLKFVGQLQQPFLGFVTGQILGKAPRPRRLFP